MSFKIVVKTLNGKQLPLNIAGDMTIRAVKEEIEKEHAMAADSLKLIAYGKVLDKDENTYHYLKFILLPLVTSVSSLI